MGYAPLDLLAQSEQPGREFEVIKQQFIKLGVGNISDMSKKEFVDFMFSKDFFNGSYKGKFKDINICLALNTESLSDYLNIPASKLGSDYDIPTEWKDLYLIPCLMDRWGRNKQVYKPDPEFADALMHTKKLQFMKEQIKYLPCKEFYIDLSACLDFSPVVGIFVFVHETNEDVSIVTCLLTDKLVYFTFYSDGKYDKNGVLEIDASDIRNVEYEVFVPNLKTLNSTEQPTYRFSRKDATCFALQLLCYITSQKPDVAENPETKKTYRPSKTGNVKNRFSEVQKWDVGIRYGKSIRTKIQEAKESVASAEKDEKRREYENEYEKSRRSPSPHFRCAHWAHY